MTDKKIRVIQYGLGPIGMESARLVTKKSGMELVGAVDISKDLIGRDLGDILGLDKALGVTVTDQAKTLFSKTGADAVLHTTGSRIRKIYPELEEIIQARLNIVSSAEELLFPLKGNAEQAERIDALAKKHGVTVLGAGVNPGFVMDALPLFMTAVCQDVSSVHVERHVDAGTRRYPLQKKIGAGMTQETFREQIANKAMGHVGLLESLYLVADSLGLSLDDVQEAVEPVVAQKVLNTAYFSLKPGDVAGIKHTAQGSKDGNKIITLDLRMFVGCEKPYDAVHILGTPEIKLRIEGGVAGDQATAAVLVNAVPAVIVARPGLATVKDLPGPYCRR